MNNYQTIETVADRLQKNYDWWHSFIRECYFYTPRNFRDISDSTGASILGESLAGNSARLIVACAGSSSDTGIEFVLHNIGPFAIENLAELSFAYVHDVHAGHIVRFDAANGDDRRCFFVARSVQVKFLGREYQGPGFLVGFEDPTAETVAAIHVDGRWRQCPQCSNIWEADGINTISRCPSCGTLTRADV
jgi:hypothetical protein